MLCGLACSRDGPWQAGGFGLEERFAQALQFSVAQMPLAVLNRMTFDQPHRIGLLRA
jgi:hypothetical protein